MKTLWQLTFYQQHQAVPDCAFDCDKPSAKRVSSRNRAHNFKSTPAPYFFQKTAANLPLLIDFYRAKCYNTGVNIIGRKGHGVMNSTMIFRQNQQINRRVLMFCFLFPDRISTRLFSRKRSAVGSTRDAAGLHRQCRVAWRKPLPKPLHPKRS